MARHSVVLVAAAVIAACSGKSERHEGSSDAATGGTTGGSGGVQPGGGVSGDGSGGTSGSGAAGSGGTAGTYVPEQTDVPPEGNGRVSGSFEGVLGDGPLATGVRRRRKQRLPKSAARYASSRSTSFFGASSR